MTKVDRKELAEEMKMENIETWNKTLYKTDSKGKRLLLANLTNATWRVVYNDGKSVDGPKGYGKLKRKNVKSISVITEDGKVLFTIPVKDDWFIIRKISLTRALVGATEEYTFQQPKRCIVLVTKGNCTYVWDDGDIDELDGFGDSSPYRKENIGVLVEGESW